MVKDKPKDTREEDVGGSSRGRGREQSQGSWAGSACQRTNVAYAARRNTCAVIGVVIVQQLNASTTRLPKEDPCWQGSPPP